MNRNSGRDLRPLSSTAASASVHQRGAGQDLLVAADTAAMDTTSEHGRERAFVRTLRPPDDPVDVFINIVVVAV